MGKQRTSPRLEAKPRRPTCANRGRRRSFCSQRSPGRSPSRSNVTFTAAASPGRCRWATCPSTRASLPWSTPNAACSSLSAASSTTLPPTFRAQMRRSRHCGAAGIRQQDGDFFRKHRAEVKETILQEIERGERQSVKTSSGRIGCVTPSFGASRNSWTTTNSSILPTTQVPPFDVKQPLCHRDCRRPDDVVHRLDEVVLLHLGHRPPAVSVPAGLTPEGLACGLADRGSRW